MSTTIAPGSTLPFNVMNATGDTEWEYCDVPFNISHSLKGTGALSATLEIHRTSDTTTGAFEQMLSATTQTVSGTNGGEGRTDTIRDPAWYRIRVTAISANTQLRSFIKA